MPMFGMGRYGMDEEERRRLAAMANRGGMAQEPIQMTQGAQRMLQSAPRMEEKPKRQSYWQGGEKFTGRDALAGGLSVIGDALMNRSGGQGGMTQALIGGRFGAIQQAREARAAAERAMMEEQSRQRQRGEKLEDLRGELEVRSEFKEPEAPRFEQDNAGNVWALDPRTGKPLSDSPVFVDRTERFMNQNGAILNVPNPYAQGGLPTRPVGKLTPVQPTIENTPAPQLGANGMPTSLTRAQYQAVVQRMGQAETEAWARRNNIRVVN